MAATDGASGIPAVRIGGQQRVPRHRLDAEAYLARHQITSVPDEFLECAERNGGQVLNHAPWDIVDAG